MPADDLADEYLILVNREHPVGNAEAPSDLTAIRTRMDGRPTQYLRRRAAQALEEMMAEMEAQGLLDGREGHAWPFSVTSGYRSCAYQGILFDTYVEQYRAQGFSEAEAVARVSRTTARPGESEHHTGLAVDMHDCLAATVRFEDSPAFAWLSENAWRFGFILRYPRGKEDITGYSYEPWHYRYVGRDHAKAIFDAGLTLEEYVKRRA